jgi:protein-S-isoprenylcysteine O-methyltransferase Ste14
MRAGLKRSLRARKLALIALPVLGILAALFVAPVWEYGGYPRTIIEWTGVFLIIVCIGGRTWCSLYIGGQKIQRLIEAGPYSVTRNPLYVFSTIGAIGIGAAFGMVSAAIITGIIALGLLYTTIPREEALLQGIHGDAYRSYRARVPRLWPNPALWRDEPTLEIRPARVRTTFLESTIFLAAIPIARVIEYLQVAGWVHPTLYLP